MLEEIKASFKSVVRAFTGMVVDALQEYERDKAVLLGHALCALVVMFILGCAAAGVYGLVGIARSDGHVTYCQIVETQVSALGQPTHPYFIVVGHRDFQSNLILASAETVDEAARVAKLVCP